MLKKKNEILKNWEKYKSFAFVKLPKKKKKKQLINFKSSEFVEVMPNIF